MMMLAPFLRLAARLGLTGRAGRVAGWIMAGIAVIALLGSLRGAWKLIDRANDRQAVGRDVAKTNLQVLQREVQADRAAGADLSNAVAATANVQQQQEERAHEARRHRRSALDDLVGNGL